MSLFVYIGILNLYDAVEVAEPCRYIDIRCMVSAEEALKILCIITAVSEFLETTKGSKPMQK
jgi:hypothetical protein